MRILLSTLFLALAFAQFANAQNPSAFEVHPNPVDTMTTADTFDSPAKGKISNVSGDTVRLKWQRTQVFLSPGISTAVCDPVTCWDTIVSSKIFILGKDSSGQLTVHFYNQFFDPAPGQPGSGIVRLKITNLDNAADTLTVLYTFNTITKTTELPAANVKLFPNPTTDFFRLTNAEEVASMRLFTIDGREVARFVHSADNTYSIANQPVGNYVLSFEDKHGQLFQAVEIYKR